MIQSYSFQSQCWACWQPASSPGTAAAPAKGWMLPGSVVGPAHHRVWVARLWRTVQLALPRELSESRQRPRPPAARPVVAALREKNKDQQIRHKLAPSNIFFSPQAIRLGSDHWALRGNARVVGTCVTLSCVSHSSHVWSLVDVVGSRKPMGKCFFFLLPHRCRVWTQPKTPNRHLSHLSPVLPRTFIVFIFLLLCAQYFSWQYFCNTSASNFTRA